MRNRLQRQYGSGRDSFNRAFYQSIYQSGREALIMFELQQEVRKLIVDNFLYGEDDGKLSYDDSFLDLGLIDSTGALELVTLLEGKYGIKIEDDELDPANLDSINKLVRFIDRKTHGNGSAKA